MKKLLITITLLSSLLSASTLYTGSNTGTYYQFGKDIKKISNVNFNIKTSKGSVENIENIMNKNGEYAIVQHDVLWHLEDTKYKDLKKEIHSILTLYPEEIHVIVKKNSMYNFISDLNNKKVSAGLKGSGTWITKELIKKSYNINFRDTPLDFKTALDELLKGNIEGIISVVGIPYKGLRELPKNISKKLRLIEMEKNSKMKKIYTRRKIPNSTYSWQDRDIYTYAPIAMLIGKNTTNTKEDTLIKTKVTNSIDRLKVLGHYKWNKTILKDLKIWPGRTNIEKIK